MDGFFIWTRDVARRRSHLKKPDLSRRIVEQGCASFGLPALKKGAGIALTRLATLRHNQMVREYVHCGKVLAQPMTSE
jgi:hypothetical protein